MTQDEYDVVSIYEDGELRMFMHRSDYDQLCASLNSPHVEPERVTSGGGIVYGIERRTATPTPKDSDG